MRRWALRAIKPAVITGFVLSFSVATASADEWTMFHHDPSHSGVSTDSTIGASNVGSLGLTWQANTGNISYLSPATAFSSSLNKTLVYTGNQTGMMAAYDVVTGERQWVYPLPAAVQSSPAIVNNVIYFGASDHYLYALNASSGQLLCRFQTPGVISSSPTVVDPDGQGLVVYFGENGVSGADDGGAEYAINAVDPNPNSAPDCSLKWLYTDFGQPAGSQSQAGSWSPPAFSTDVNSRALVVFGSSSPEGAVYALDALTGARVWRFQTQIIGLDDDVGAGPTITAPGVNGFADGVVYVAGKDKIVYALNLRTGAKIWEFSIRADSSTVGGNTRSTAAIVGNVLYIGYGAGVYALNATTGLKIWKTQQFGVTTKEVISSPAVTGSAAPGGRVLFVADLGGKIRAFSAATGHQLWSYQTGGYVYGSGAIADGKVFFTSSDGFLYAFGLGGGVSQPPATTVTSPVSGSTLANPNGSIAFSGSSSDDSAVAKVLVAVKNKNSNQWWNPTANAWTKVFTEFPANLTNPGAAPDWNASFPVPSIGGVFYVQADAVDSDGQHDPTVASSSFTIGSRGNPPNTAITSPVYKQIFYFPNGRFSFVIPITGTATDVSAGAHPGIRKVNISVRNIEHGDYYCGPAGCPGAPAQFWQPTFISYLATLSNPGALSTNWSSSFPTYDHPHTYRIMAWAVDLNYEVDQTRASVDRICVRDPGDTTCS